MNHFGDPERCVYGPRQVADIEATVKESGEPHCRRRRVCRYVGGGHGCRCSPCLPVSPGFLARVAVAAGRPWQVMITQVVMGQLKAPRLAETAHLQPKLLAWLCK